MVQSFTVFDTVALHQVDENNVFFCHITSLSDSLKNEIRSKLVGVCRGLAREEKQLPHDSYDLTLNEFLRRYAPKSDDTKKGMIGELLSHILIRQLVESFSPISPFFNMEESSIKKAFDIVFHCTDTDEIWFTEVKSGQKTTQTSKAKNNGLLHLAKRSIEAQMTGDDFHIWDNAIHNATIAMRATKVRDQIERLLSTCSVQAQRDELDTDNLNVVLTSVLYADAADTVLLDDIVEVRTNIDNDDVFKDLIVFSIQKETYEAVEHFLQSEAA